MSARTVKWTPDRVAAAVAAFSSKTALADGLAAASAAVGFPVNRAAMESIVKRSGETRSLGALLAADPGIAERNLVAEREQKEKRARDERATKSLVDEVRELRARQDFLDKLAADRQPPKIFAREKTGVVREMTPVVLASDWHVEELVTAESVAYRNEYNLAIADDRVKRFFQAIAWNIEHQRASGWVVIRDLLLWLGGDLMTGYIHEELVESNQLSPTETILWLLPRLEAGIRMLLDRLKLDRIVIPCSFGNHGRTTQKPRISTAYSNSYEWLMYHTLALRFEGNPRVRFEITASAHQYVEVYGRTIHFHHGDDVKYQGGVGGLGIPLLKAVPPWDLVKKADVHCIGHWHQLRDYGRAVVNGSLIGFGPFSQRIRAEFEPPQQAMFYVDSHRGKTMLTHLWVAEREKEEK